jgi:hypothetical protein
MKLSEQEVQVRKDIYSEAAKIADVYDRILAGIRKCESEKRVQKALKKLRIHMETFERQNLHFGLLN